jgi:hypothetical protein
MAPIRSNNLKKLFGKLTPYTDNFARGVSNYGDEALDYGLNIRDAVNHYDDDIARAFNNDIDLNALPSRSLYDLEHVNIPPVKENYLPEVSAYLDDVYDNISTENNLYGNRFSDISPSQLSKYLDSADRDSFRDAVPLEDMYRDTLDTIAVYDKAAKNLNIPTFDPKGYKRLQELYKILENEVAIF